MMRSAKILRVLAPSGLKNIENQRLFLPPQGLKSSLSVDSMKSEWSQSSSVPVLLSGQNPIQPPRRFISKNKISAPLPPYEAYMARHAQAMRTDSMQNRKNLIHYVNTTMMPKLHTEEAALQILLAPVANLQWEKGWQFNLFIQKDLDQNPVDAYAKSYCVDDVFSNPKGGFGVHMRPEDALSTKADLLLIPGTYCMRPTERDPVALKNKRPIGIRDDLRWRGIGSQSFANIKIFADNALLQAQISNRKLVVAGHSLGSAVALRWLASLTPEQQQHVQVFAFVPPGLDRATALRLRGAADRIKLFPHIWDIVRFSGHYRAPGQERMVRDYVAEGSKLKSHHARPQLAIREMRGEQPSVGPAKNVGARFVFVSVFLEAMRRLFGFIFWPFLPN